MESNFFIIMAIICFVIVLFLVSSKKISNSLKIKESLFYVILSIIFLTLLIFTNPTSEQLRAEIKRKMMSKSIDIDEPNSYLEMNLKEKALDMVVDNHIIISNLLIFSLMKYDIGGNEKIIGVGLLGNIYTREMPRNVSF